MESRRLIDMKVGATYILCRDPRWIITVISKTEDTITIERDGGTITEDLFHTGSKGGYNSWLYDIILVDTPLLRLIYGMETDI